MRKPGLDAGGPLSQRGTQKPGKGGSLQGERETRNLPGAKTYAQEAPAFRTGMAREVGASEEPSDAAGRPRPPLSTPWHAATSHETGPPS